VYVMQHTWICPSMLSIGYRRCIAGEELPRSEAGRHFYVVLRLGTLLLALYDFVAWTEEIGGTFMCFVYITHERFVTYLCA
jgi:hypothetical protein